MKVVLVYLLCSIAILGCNKAVDPGPVNSYPTIKDNTWNYNASAFLTNFRPIVVGATFRDSVIRWNAQTQSGGRDTLRDSIETWKFIVSERGVFNLDGIAHYITRGDSLKLFAYENPSLALPKQNSRYHFNIAGRHFNTLQHLFTEFYGENQESNVSGVSLYYESNPPPVLIFPLTVGRQWTYRPAPFRIDKKIVGTERISTPAGDFACYKMQWFWDTNTDGKWDSLITGYDFLSSTDLIKRSIEVKNVVLSDETNPEGIGYIDIINEYVITDLEGSIFPAIHRNP